MQRLVIIPALVLLLSGLVGCGGGSSSSSNKVTSINVIPTTISINSGAVQQITATANNASNSAVAVSAFTFTSSNINVATISPSGEVCGGTWDANFIVCNGLDASGHVITGVANITVSAAGITSSPVPVTVHVGVSSVVVDPQPANCDSTSGTQLMTPHVCSTAITPHAASGPCAPNAAEITSSAGTLTWGSLDTTVATVDTNGVVTGVNPGQTQVFASVSNVNSPGVNFRTCMPVLINLHAVGQPGTNSVSLSTAQNIQIQADWIDENGNNFVNLPSAIVSNNAIAATVTSTSPATLTTVSSGGAGVVAACIPPSCGNGLNMPIYSNVFNTKVVGTSPAPIIYATTSFGPPSGSLPAFVFIDSSTGTVGTSAPNNLPGVPNSLVFSRAGNFGFMGSTAGLLQLNPNGNVVTVVAPLILGKVLAVSPNGTKVIVSNAGTDPATGLPLEPNPANQRVFVFDQTSNTFQTFNVAGVVAADFDADGFRDYLVASDGNVYVFSPTQSLVTVSPAVGGSSTGVTSLPSESFVYVANSGGLKVLSTCNNKQVASAPTTSTPQLVQSAANSDMVVAVNTTGVDIDTVNKGSIQPSPPVFPFIISPANCAPSVTYSNQFIDFGLGAFTARQLLVATNSTRAVVLPNGINKVLSAVPGGGATAIALPAGATGPLAGGLTPDGNIAWIGVAGTNTVDKIDLVGGTDTVQIPTAFKKTDGTAAPPNIIAVLPK